MVEVANKPPPLEELMLAMDVVDTLRHRQVLVDRELDTEGRRSRLVERLREIYAAQGIEVTDQVLREGVLALEQDRFVYQPPPQSFKTRLAEFYTSRSVWGKPVSFLLGILVLGALFYYVAVGLPQAREQAALPSSLSQTFAEVVNVAEEKPATDQAQALLQNARKQIAEDNYPAAQATYDELRALLKTLEQVYSVRIVSRPDQLSGIWRVPAVNPDARNYYLIVESVDSAGVPVTLAIFNEEDQARNLVSTWGVRVDETTFESVAADKKDDGIIQDDVVGRKTKGKLAIEYLVPTTGDTITKW